MNKDEKKTDEKEANKKKGFWRRLIEKLDKTMVEKAKQPSCCGKESKGGKCC